MQRRKAVSLILLTIALFLTESPRAQAPAFAVRQLAPNVWAAIADAIGPAGGNSGFVVGDDGVLVIDTFVNAETGKQLLAEIRKRTTLPIKYVINTHHHFDHTGGNRAFADTGAVIMAQRNVRNWITSENLRGAGPNVPPELKAIIDGIAAPTVLYDDGIDLYLGSRKVEVRGFPGHTGGDSIVLVPDAHIVFCGDLFWRHTLPNLVDATTKSWVETLDILATSEPTSTFVPGHGDVGTIGDLQAFHEYLQTLRMLVAEGQRQGKAGDALVEAVLPMLTEKYRDWNWFEFAKQNISDVSAELGGTKRIPAVNTTK